MFDLNPLIAKSWQRIASLVLLFCLSAFTQLYKLTDVPGLHFDEAWQGLYAHRIAIEAGFWPFSAMNSYTSPIVHYLLAAAFKIFSPTLFVMRFTYGVMNLATLLAVACLLWRHGRSKAALWFALLWSLLPLSVHSHRFYIEMTGFHGLCLAAVLWACSLWNEKPKLSSFLLFAGIVLGAYSHILFISVCLTLVFIWPWLKDNAPLRSARVIGLVAISISPLAFNMGLSLHKKTPLLLGLFLLVGGGGLFSFSFVNDARQAFIKWRTKLKKPFIVGMKLFYVVALPFSIFYIGFLWDGFWTYAQVTGSLSPFWLPLNGLIFLATMYYFFQKLTTDADTVLIWRAFIVLFVFCSAMILKQAPRYYMTVTILGMMWVSLVLSQLSNQRMALWLFPLIMGWNGYAFFNHYINPFENFGGLDRNFSLGPFKDSNRDFRPFQKAYRWAQEQGCGPVIHWVEDDRFLRPIEFLQISTPPSSKQCPWNGNDLLFSHWPPPEIGNVKIVAQRQEWGDLTFSERIKKSHAPVEGK